MNSLKSEIYSKGQRVTSNIVSIDIMKCINKVPYAQVVLCEGGENDISAAQMSSDDYFKPGKEIEISLTHEKEEGVFKGIVVKHSIKKTLYNTFLIIDIKDSSHKLTLLKQNTVFNDKEDKQIISDIAGKKKIDVECDATTCKHKQIVQYYCTDWDFIVSRAEANGLLVCAENGKLLLKKPDLGNASTDLSDLSEIYEYELEADLSTQYKEIESICWDIKNAEPAKFKNTNSSSLESAIQSKQNFNELSALLGTEKYELVNDIYSEKEEMEAWANASMIKNRHSMVRGRISIKGNPKLKVGDTIKISQAGDVLEGKAFVSGIRHRINNDGWITDIQCGLSREWFYKTDDIIERPAAGLLPGINGLHIGIVEAYPSDGDPDNFHRIKVRIPAVDEKESVLWARLIFPYAGDKRGMFFIPEEGDEVVVGFFNDDPRHAVVLGSLYNGKTETPLEFTDKNNEKGLITRNDIKIIFTDEKDKEKIEITTPGGNKALLEDENGITVEDKNKNKVILHDKGISLEDKNKNKITTDDKGTIVEDTNKNSLAFNNEGIEINDLNGNTIMLSPAGIEIKDMNGHKVTLEASGITIKSAAMVNVNGSMINLN
ncbi:MAG: type VI secretion system tip protein VgrG [bacterium]